MKGHTLSQIQAYMQDLGVTWADVKITYYSVFFDRPYYAIKLPVSSSGGYKDWLSYRVHPSTVQAVFNRLPRERP